MGFSVLGGQRQSRKFWSELPIDALIPDMMSTLTADSALGANPARRFVVKPFSSSTALLSETGEHSFIREQISRYRFNIFADGKPARHMRYEVILKAVAEIRALGGSIGFHLIGSA